jgi:hypothetical protein
MYCQSCQTRLSPRDERCPTCGRKAGSSKDLGASSSSENDSSRSFPLPPAAAIEDNGTSKPQRKGSAAPRKAQAAAPRTGRRKADRQRSSVPAPAPTPEPALSVGPAQVRRVIVEHPSLVEPGLEIHCEDGKAVGGSYETEVGEIDLLARDDAGGWVIVAIAEPDRGKEIVGDLLQRMGWVRRHLGQSGQEVRGIVLLDSLPDDLGYAAAAVSDTVEFRLYQMALTLEPVIV